MKIQEDQYRIEEVRQAEETVRGMIVVDVVFFKLFYFLKTL